MRKTTTHWIILAYCVLLWFTNWRWDISRAGDTSSSYKSIDLRGLGAFLGAIIALICIRRAWKLIRELLAVGARIPLERRLLGDWSMLWYLLPLLVSFGSPSHRTETSDAIAASDFQYGGSVASLYSMIFSAMAIILFQAVVNLESQHAKHIAESGERADIRPGN